MLIGALLVKIYIPGAASLKEKRRVIKSVTQKIRNRFNVSVAEINNENRWQRATLGVAVIGDSQVFLERQLQLILNFMDAEPRWEVTETEITWR